MTKKIILFNAPALGGKNIAIDYLQDNGYDLHYAECKDKLHTLVQEFFCVYPERYWEIYGDRNLKELPLGEFSVTLDKQEEQLLCKKLNIARLEYSFGTMKHILSIRHAMIYISEIIMKPRMGTDFFGWARLQTVCSEPYGLFVDSSCGFAEELPPIINKMGQENILLLRIHRDGCTFDGDSRNYIKDGVITNTVDICNNGTLQEYFEKVKIEVDKFLNKGNK